MQMDWNSVVCKFARVLPHLCSVDLFYTALYPEGSFYVRHTISGQNRS
jgi:hypothetical protein